jgi:competence protein ComEA
VCEWAWRGRGVIITLLAALLLPLGRPALALAQPASVAVRNAPLDLNSASAVELVALRHIGKSKARKILKGRPWKSKDQLVERGILTPAEYDAIKELIVARRP